MIVRCLILALLLAGCASAQPPEQLLSHAFARLDGERFLAEGATIESEGFVDLEVLQQGRAPGVSEPAAYREALRIAPGGGALAFSYDTPVNPDARETMRYVLDGRGVRGAVPDAGIAFWETRSDMPPRLRALSPVLLLQDALAQGALRDLGGRRVGARIAGEDVVLAFSAAGDLTSIARTIDMPLRGPTEWRWSYLPPSGNGAFPNYPGGYEVRLDEDVLRRVTHTRVARGSETALRSIDHPNLSDSPPAASDPPPLTFRELAPGVFVARHVRPGFHHLVVESGDQIIVVDAPAGWLETTIAPPMEWVEGATSSSISEQFVSALHERFPDKAITLVLTHWHSDHAGGVPPFADAGADILGSSETLRAIGAILPPQHRFTEVTERRVLPGGVHVLPVHDNPHAEGMLAVHLPEHDLLYVADLFEGGSQQSFPNPARRPVMSWFVRWLDSGGMRNVTVIGAHGAPSQPWMLERLRELPALTAQ